MRETRSRFVLALALTAVAAISPLAQTQPRKASATAQQAVPQIQQSNAPTQQAPAAARDPELERRIAILEAQVQFLTNSI